MIAAIVIVSLLLLAVFIFAVIAGNRAQTRMVERAREVDRKRDAG